MTSIIKNQIIKHLSKFVKNLSSDQISLSALKGEGDLTNIQLNESVLSELLELPNWLRLVSASCNRVSARIPWTKLKSIPIQLLLDEVKVCVETVDDIEDYPKSAPSTHSQTPNISRQYGFAEKVLDGARVQINSIHLHLCSRVFKASFQISRVVVESKCGNWTTPSDLRTSRLKNVERGEILTFKEITWHSVRVEASGRNLNTTTTSASTTPIRLITNQASCRVTLKKKLSDCSVVGCRLLLIMDDIVWVLTDTQLLATLHFADSLSDLLKTATEQTQMKKGARKLKSFYGESTKSGSPTVGGGRRGSYFERGRTSSSSSKSLLSTDERVNNKNSVFYQHDICETSYHIFCDKIDLHLCEDSKQLDDRNEGGCGGVSSHPNLVCANFQVSLSGLQFDFYPFHLTSSPSSSTSNSFVDGRSHWFNYNSPPSSPTSASTSSLVSKWMCSEVTRFKELVIDRLCFRDEKQPHHPPLTRTSVGSSPSSASQKHNKSSFPPNFNNCNSSLQNNMMNGGGGFGVMGAGGESNCNNGGALLFKSLMFEEISSQLNKLMSTNVVIKLSDLTMWKVESSNSSTSSASSKSSSNRQFIRGDCDGVSSRDEGGYRRMRRRQQQMGATKNNGRKSGENGVMLHLEYAQYYYPNNVEFPLPPPQLFMYVNEICVDLDEVLTIIWLNAFLCKMENYLLQPKLLSSTTTDEGHGRPQEQPYLDVKVEITRVKVSVRPNDDHDSEDCPPFHVDRPHTLQLCLCGVSVSNFRSPLTSTKRELLTLLHSFNKTNYDDDDFPHLIPDQFIQHANVDDNVTSAKNLAETLDLIDSEEKIFIIENEGSNRNICQSVIRFFDNHKDLFWLDQRHVWSVNVDDLEALFLMDAPKGQMSLLSVPLLSSPLIFKSWIHLHAPPLQNSKEDTRDKIHVICEAYVETSNTTQCVSVQLDRMKLIYLLRITEMVNEMSHFANLDKLGQQQGFKKSIGEEISVALLMKQSVSLHVILPFTEARVRDMLPSNVNEKAAKTELDISIAKCHNESPRSLISDDKSLRNLRKPFSSPTCKSDHLPLMFSPPATSSSSPSNSTSSPPHSLLSIPSLTSACSTFQIASEAIDESESIMINGNVMKKGNELDMASMNTGVVKCRPDKDGGSEVEGFTDDGETNLEIMSSYALLSSAKHDCKINVLSIDLTNVQLTHFGVGGKWSEVKIQSNSINITQQLNTQWNEFQSKIRFMSHKSRVVPYDDLEDVEDGIDRENGAQQNQLHIHLKTCQDVAKIQKSMNSAVENDDNDISSKSKKKNKFDSLRRQITDLAEPTLNVTVCGVMITNLNKSVLEGLTDFMQDEIICPFVPMKIILSDVFVRLIEDIDHCDDVTFPSPIPPTDFNIPHTLVISRDGKSGVFSIQSSPSLPQLTSEEKCTKCSSQPNTSSFSHHPNEMLHRRLQMENATLRVQSQSHARAFEEANSHLLNSEVRWAHERATLEEDLQMASLEIEALRRTLAHLQDEPRRQS